MATGPMKLTQTNIRAGEGRAFRLFRDKVDASQGQMISKSEVQNFSGAGTQMVNDVYGVARHIEGAARDKRLGRKDGYWAKKGVDDVSLPSIRGALSKLGSGLIARAKTKGNKDGVLNGTVKELGKSSDAGSTLARFIQATK